METKSNFNSYHLPWVPEVFLFAIFAIFVAQSFQIAGTILVTFAIFAKFADISKPFLTFSLSKCCIL